MDKLISKFTKKKQGNLLSDPAGSNVLRSPKAVSSTSSSSSHASKHPDYNYEPAPHSYVGGDGAIGGLEWANESESIGEGYEGGMGHEGVDSHESLVQVPTLGQVDQLTEAEEQAVAEAQAAMTMPMTSAPISVVDDNFDEFAMPLTRSRSTDAQPPPPSQPSILVQPTAISGVPVVANVNVIDQPSVSPTDSLPQPTPQPTPTLSSITPAPASIVTPTTPSLLSSPIPTNMLSGSAAASAAALVPGSRSTSTGTVVTAHTLGSSSKPNSRRNSEVGISSSPTTPTMSPVTASTDSPSKNNMAALALNSVTSDGTHPPLHPTPSSHATTTATTASAGATTTTASSQPNSAAPTNEPRRSVSASQAVLTPNPAAAAASTPLPKQLGFSYPAQPMSRPTISGGAHAHAFSIGRAAMSEVKALVGQERLTTSSGSVAALESSSQQSPGFLAYSTAIAEAKEKARREKETQKKSGGLFSSLTLGKDKDKEKEKEKGANNNNKGPITGAPTPANPKPFPQLGRQPSAHSLPIPVGGLNTASNPSAVGVSGAHGPPLPPRTHIRHRYSMTKYGSRRGSVSGPSVEKESQQQKPLTLDQLIPLRPLTHLYSTAYLLMYFAFHLYLPAVVALILPLLMYFLVLRIVQPYFQTEEPAATASETEIAAAISALAETIDSTRSRNTSNASNGSTSVTPAGGSLSAAMIPPLSTSDIPPTPLEAVDDHNWDFEAEIEQSRRRRDGVVGGHPSAAAAH